MSHLLVHDGSTTQSSKTLRVAVKDRSTLTRGEFADAGSAVVDGNEAVAGVLVEAASFSL